jgi:hypothetical protein
MPTKVLTNAEVSEVLGIDDLAEYEIDLIHEYLNRAGADVALADEFLSGNPQDDDLPIRVVGGCTILNGRFERGSFLNKDFQLARDTVRVTEFDGTCDGGPFTLRAILNNRYLFVHDENSIQVIDTQPGA